MRVYVFHPFFKRDETILPLAHVFETDITVVMCAAPRRNDRTFFLAVLERRPSNHPILTGMKSINCCGRG
jgi:hypothetical protein